MVIRPRYLSFCLFFAALASLHAQRNRISSQIDGRSTVVLHGHTRPQANAGNDRGAVEPSFRVPGMTLMLKPAASQQAALKQVIAEQQDPSSPNFHKWLTPEQYADAYGVSAEDVAKITDWLKSQGFTVQNVARSRTFITFSGTAAQAQQAFRAPIHRYDVNGVTHYANASDPAIPAALADVVATVHGLSNFRMHPHIKRPLTPDMNLSGGTHHIAPEDFASIYNTAPLLQAGVDGTGQKIAVVGQTAIKTSDIDSFRNKFGLGASNLQQVLVPGRSNPGILTDDMEEADLDIEWAGAVAPKATIVYVYSDDVFASAIHAIDQNLAPVLTMSYGACELWDLFDLPSFQALAQQANAQGMTWLSASGDSGAADCELSSATITQTGLGVDVPASIPEVTAMGGTTLNEGGGSYWAATQTGNFGSALSYIPETSWNDSGFGGLSSTGGGGSVFFPRPIWQTGQGVPNDGVRHVPDISLSASANHDGYYFYTNGGSGYVGGTSVAAPAMAGIVALMNHYLVSTGAQGSAGVGNINPGLYRLFQSNPNVFHDVTTGSNSVPCASNSPGCVNGLVGLNAGPGYDEVTGLGSVDAFNLVHAWSDNPARSSAVVMSIDQNPVYKQAADASGNFWRFQLLLNEEAGIATKLTGLIIDGVDYSSQIASIFGSAAIPARGSITGKVGLKSVNAPKTVAIVFSGVDATGLTWTHQLSVPFGLVEVPLAVAGASNAANGQQAYAPGMILSVYGTTMGMYPQSAGTIPLPIFLAGFEANVNGVDAPLYFVSPNQVNIQIPYETKTGNATLTIGNPYQNVTYRLRIVATAPGIFTSSDGYVNPSRSGARGQTVSLFITGEGQVKPALATGATPSSRTALASLPKPVGATSVSVGGVNADIPFIGIPSGLVGVTQINFTIPPTAPLGPQQVVVTVGAASSTAATINVTQ